MTHLYPGALPMPPSRRKLPIGIQTFAQIVGEGYYYSAPIPIVEFPLLG